jgi:hypothetical protein
MRATDKRITQHLVVEHIIMQKIIFNGEESHWRLWGTVDPTMADVEKALAKKEDASESLLSQMKSRVGTMTGLGM